MHTARMRMKIFLKKEDSKVLVISLIFGLVVLLINRNEGIFRNLSDFCFTAGILHVLDGFIRYISNVGLFKTFSYMRYKSKWKKQADHTDGMRPMTLGEYTMKVVWDETRQKEVLPVVGKGALILVFSVILAIADSLI